MGLSKIRKLNLISYFFWGGGIWSQKQICSFEISIEFSIFLYDIWPISRKKFTSHKVCFSNFSAQKTQKKDRNATNWRKCSEKTLTRETRFQCEFVHPRDTNHWPPRWEENSWPLVQWDCVGVKLQGLHGAPPSNLTGALTGHCVLRRRRTSKEWNGTGEDNVWSQLAFHIVGAKPSEASHCQHGA